MLKSLERDFDQYDTEFVKLQSSFENVDNQSRKNNAQLKSLTKGAQREGLIHNEGGHVIMNASLENIPLNMLQTPIKKLLFD